MKFCIHIYIDKIKPRDYQMSFVIGQGFAKVQILKKKKKWNWPYLLNLLEYLIKFWTHINIDKI